MKTIDIALKDLLRSFRSLFAIGMMVVAPLMLTGLIYFAFSGMGSEEEAAQLPDIQVAVVNLDQEQPNLPFLGGMVLEFLQDERMPDWLIVSTLNNEDAALEAIEGQKTDVAVVIPVDFSASLAETDASSTLTILHDPTITVGPEIVKSLLQQFVDGVSGAAIVLEVMDNQSELSPQEQAAAAEAYMNWFTALQQNLNHDSQPVFTVQAPTGLEQSGDLTANPMGNMIGLIMAGQMIFFAFYTGAYTTTSLLQEKEDGTLARLFSTPTPRSTVLAGKFVAVFVMVVVQGLIVLTVSGFAFGIQWGNPAAAAMVLIGQVAAAGGLGIFIISFMRSTKQSGPVLGGGLTVLGMLGGLFTVAVPMPAAFEMINLFTPQGWALRGWRLVLSGAGTAEVLLPTAVLLLIGAVLFALGARNFSFKKGFGTGN